MTGWNCTGWNSDWTQNRRFSTALSNQLKLLLNLAQKTITHVYFFWTFWSGISCAWIPLFFYYFAFGILTKGTRCFFSQLHVIQQCTYVEYSVAMVILGRCGVEFLDICLVILQSKSYWCTVHSDVRVVHDSFVQRNNSKYQCVKEDKTQRSQMRKFQRCHVEFKFIRPKLLLLQPLCAY